MKKAENITTKQNSIWTLNRTDLCYMLLLAAGTLLFVLVLTGNNHLYGSQVDWINQHSVLPEYFRQQFYATGNLLPDFAAHLGGGQNIFHFSYYGLLSPVILPSYLLPGLAMTDYLAAVSVFLLVLSGTLGYYWLRKQSLSPSVALAAAFLFQFSSALLYHSHKQIMFVNYIPFLLLALLGAGFYFDRKKSGLLMTGIFLMTMTSYFYSIGGLLVLTVYGIYLYFRKYSGRGVRQFFLTGFSYAIRLLIPVGMAALLLLPSLAAIFNGRSGETRSLVLSELLIPGLNLLDVLYSPYGVGLTAVSVLAVFRLATRKRAGEQVLFGLLSVLFSFPLFLYLLNGGLYLRGKVFIPFLPLFILITALLLEEIKEACQGNVSPFLRTSTQIHSTALPGKRLSLLRRIKVLQQHMLQDESRIFYQTGMILLCLLLLSRSPIWLGFGAECILVVGGILLGIRRHSFFLSCLPSCLVCFCICVGVNVSDPLVTSEQAQSLYSEDKQELLEKLEAADDSFFRFNDFTENEASCNLVSSPAAYRTSLYSSTYDADYNEFHSHRIGNSNSADNSIARRDSENILFQTFMGVKYLISENGAPTGYEKIEQKGNYSLYRNDNVFPLAWGSTALMSRSEFDTLSDAEQSVALLNYIIVDSEVESGYTSPLKEEKFSLPLSGDERFQTERNGEYLRINLEQDTELSLPLASPLNERLLLLSMDFAEEPGNDIVIGVNRTANRLTGKKEMYPNENYHFRYIISDNRPTGQLNLSFSAGSYQCSMPRMYSMDVGLVEEAANSVSPMEYQGLGTDGTVLRGVVSMDKDGYFTASIPYDKGFTALVDGIPTSVELVNTAFVGFPLSAGQHEIAFIYHAPMLAEGKYLSGICLILFLCILALEQAEVLLRRKYASYRRLPAPGILLPAPGGLALKLFSRLRSAQFGQ